MMKNKKKNITQWVDVEENHVKPVKPVNPVNPAKTGFAETVIPKNITQVNGSQKLNVKLCPDISNIGNSINNKKYFIPSQFPNLTKKNPIPVDLKKASVPRGGRKSYKLIKKRKCKNRRKK